MSTVHVAENVRCVVFFEGTHIALVPGMPFDDGDPVVAAHPQLFTRDYEAPPRVTSVRVLEDGTVEQATAVPGERRRGPGRPRKVWPE